MKNTEDSILTQGELERYLAPRLTALERVRKARAALVVVIHSEIDYGYMVGIAVENESGYYPTETIIENHNYNVASAWVDKANAIIHPGRTKDDFTDIVAGSMRKR